MSEKKFVLLDTLGRMIVGPMGAPVAFETKMMAKVAALRRVEPTRVAEMVVVFDPCVVN
jgi:hypothetical protein